MKKRILFMTLAVVVLAAGIAAGYWIATGDAAGTDKPDWQVVIEQRVAPLVISAISTVCAWWVANQPAISKINAAAAAAAASAAGFDGAAGGIVNVASTAQEVVAAVNALVARIEALEAKNNARYEEEHKLLLGGLKMIGLGFSHEAELVKNGTAREIMRMEEEYEAEN